MKIKPLTLLLALTFLFLFSGSSVVFGDDLQDGKDAYNKEDFKTAYEIWLPLAKQGDRDAQYNLGLMYRKGEGVPQDDKEAVKWYRLAAEQGNANAQSSLGVMYREGSVVRNGTVSFYKESFKLFRLSADQGNSEAQYELGKYYNHSPDDYFMYDFEGERDFKKANKWFRLAADQGNRYAQYLLGVNYYRGNGVQADWEEALNWYKLSADQGYTPAAGEVRSVQRDLKIKKLAEQGDDDAQVKLGEIYKQQKNYKEAVKWYRLAADRGNVYGQVNLGVMYEFGHGVPKDLKEAVRLYRIPADQEFSHALFALGNLYYQGKGVPKDLKEAIKLYQLAAVQGHKKAKENLNKKELQKILKEKEKKERLKRWMVEAEKYRPLVIESCEKNEDPNSCITVSSCAVAAFSQEMSNDIRIKKFLKKAKGSFFKKGSYEEAGKYLEKEMEKSGDKSFFTQQLSSLSVECVSASF